MDSNQWILCNKYAVVFAVIDISLFACCVKHVVVVAGELEGHIREAEESKAQVSEERDQARADLAAVTDECSKYSQIVADLQGQMVGTLVYWREQLSH